MRALRFLAALSVFIGGVGLPLVAILSRILPGASASFVPAPFLGEVTAFTLKQASLSLLFSVLVGIPLGLLAAARSPTRLRRIFLAIFSLPSLALVGMMIPLARLGLPGLGFGLPLVILSHVYLNAPWIALSVMEAEATYPRVWTELARGMGATRFQAFTRFFLPWMANRVALASAQVFAFCVMSFALVLLLGGGPPTSTLETEIYALVRGGGLALGHAAQFAGAQLLLAGIPLVLASGWKPFPLEAVDTDPSHNHRRDRVAEGLGFLFLFAPLIVLGGDLLRTPGFAISPLGSVLREDEAFWSALRASLVLATGASLLGLLLTLAFCLPKRFGFWTKGIRALAAIPIGVSPIVLSLGFLLAYGGGFFDLGDPFENGARFIVLLQGVLALPFGLRLLLPVLDESEQAARRDLVFTARALGADPWTAWRRCEWPHFRGAILDFLRLAWIWSLMDMAVASFFSSEGFFTLPVWIARKLAHYEFASAQGVLFAMTLVSTGVLLFEKSFFSKTTWLSTAGKTRKAK